MSDPQTCPVLVPPPPVPPGGRVAAASSEPSREPSRIASSFIDDVMREIKRVVWPANEHVRAASGVTIGVLLFFTLFIQGLSAAVSLLFAALGLHIS